MTATTPTAEPASESAKAPIAALIVAVLLGTFFSASIVSGVVYFLAQSGRLRMLASATTDVKQAQRPVTHAVIMEPLLVNLADASGNAYLRLGITLRVAEANDRPAAGTTQAREGAGSTGEAKDGVAALRDTTLAVLGRQTSSDLLAANGKEHLKSELRRALAERNGDVKVTDLYFTEFLVQR